jgi:hypothetical protein
MAKSSCPNCTSSAIRAQNESYCARCGWNLERTGARLEVSLAQSRTLWFGLLVISTILLPFGIFGHLWTEYSAITAVFLLALLADGKQRLQLRSLRIAGSLLPAWDSTIAIDCEKDLRQKWQALFLLPARRDVRISIHGKGRIVTAAILLVFMVVLLFFLAWYAWVTARREGYLSDVPFWRFQVSCLASPLLAVGFGTWMDFRRGTRAKELLRHGEVAVGKVVAKLEPARGYYEYVFQDAQGRERFGAEKTSEKKLSVGMFVPVLYDSSNESDKYAYVRDDFFDILDPASMPVRTESSALASS